MRGKITELFQYDQIPDFFYRINITSENSYKKEKATITAIVVQLQNHKHTATT